MTEPREVRTELPDLSGPRRTVLRWLHAGESVILRDPVDVGEARIAPAVGHLAI